VEGELNQATCEALIGLNAKAVVGLPEDLEKGGLRSILEVKDAVRDAGLSARVGEAGQGGRPRRRSSYLAGAGSEGASLPVHRVVHHRQ
jgi:hypothetical protein